MDHTKQENAEQSQTDHGHVVQEKGFTKAKLPCPTLPTGSARSASRAFVIDCFLGMNRLREDPTVQHVIGEHLKLGLAYTKGSSEGQDCRPCLCHSCFPASIKNSQLGHPCPLTGYPARDPWTARLISQGYDCRPLERLPVTQLTSFPLSKFANFDLQEVARLFVDPATTRTNTYDAGPHSWHGSGWGSRERSI